MESSFNVSVFIERLQTAKFTLFPVGLYNIFIIAQQGMLLQPIIAEHLFLYEFQSTPCQPVTPVGLSHISHAPPPITDLTDIASLTRNLLTYPHQSSSLG